MIVIEKLHTVYNDYINFQYHVLKSANTDILHAINNAVVGITIKFRSVISPFIFFFISTKYYVEILIINGSPQLTTPIKYERDTQ